MEKLALLGGEPIITEDRVPPELFGWPVITDEDEAAALDVIRRGKMSGTLITEEFQKEFAVWSGRRFAVGYCNGTLSLHAAMFGIGLGAGDELICPTKTYWASCAQATNLGATVVFANIDKTLCIDPNDLERCLSPRTKAIMVVHYFGHPADMDAIMAFARKHKLMVIEDVSHAQGGLYKGKKLGTFGDVAAMSLMSSKSFACGEMGMLITDDRKIYERALAFSHYEHNNEKYITEAEEIKPYYHMPLGAMKGRVNQVCSAIGRVQLKYYDERCAEIRRALNEFWDILEGTAGIRPIRVDESDGSNMAGWYAPHGLYVADELDGLPVTRFCEAIRAEIPFPSHAGGNFPLHTHNYFKTFDLFNLGKPTRVAFAERDVRELDGCLEPSMKIECFSVPWFKKYMPEYIALFASAFKKVVENHDALLEKQTESNAAGRWYGTDNDSLASR